MSSICLAVLSKGRTIPNVSSSVVDLPFEINLRRMSLLLIPAISVSLSCSSLSVYSQSLAMMRARVIKASTVSVGPCFKARSWNLETRKLDLGLAYSSKPFQCGVSRIFSSADSPQPSQMYLFSSVMATADYEVPLY